VISTWQPSRVDVTPSDHWNFLLSKSGIFTLDHVKASLETSKVPQTRIPLLVLSNVKT
jgi:hypothetical protein